MSDLRIFLFGNVQIIHADSQTIVKMTRTTQALLGYLLLHRHRPHQRELLAGIFWGDHTDEQARSCLNTALWRFRQVLEPEGIPRGTYLLTTSTNEVSFNPASDHWLDVAIFEEGASQVLAEPIEAMEGTDVHTLEQILQLYRGELLEGFYDDWVLQERERMRRLYLNSLAHLLYYYKHQRNFERSLVCGQRILDQDSLREEIHREMIRLYLDSGQRALAVRQCQACKEILAAELGIPPMEETRVLYKQCIQSPGSQQGQTEELTLQKHALQQLRHAMQQFEEARGELQRAIQLIERFIGQD